MPFRLQGRNFKLSFLLFYFCLFVCVFICLHRHCGNTNERILGMQNKNLAHFMMFSTNYVDFPLLIIVQWVIIFHVFQAPRLKANPSCLRKNIW